MKKYLIFIALFLFNGLLVAQIADSNAVDGEVYFQLTPDAAASVLQMKSTLSINAIPAVSQLKASYRVKQVAQPFKNTSSNKLQRTFLLRYANIYAVDSIINELKKNPDVVYAEKAPLFYILFTPNDLFYNLSGDYNWFLEQIKAPEAWNLEKGNSNVKVAVLDNAIWINHPDLKSKIVSAIDLANGDSDPTPPDKTVEWSHGTHVSGLAGGATNNKIGIASIGFNVSLMAVKISSDSTDGGTMSYGYQGIIWAADHGADVINMSWGGNGYFQTGQNVVNYAYNKGCVLIAAAGNDNNSDILYPAGYEHVISVASVDYDDRKSSFSSYGNTVDVSAPGGYNASGYSIFSTVFYQSSSYGFMQGTSMATPVVSGLAGLMLSADSTLTPDKLTAIMKASSVNIDSLNPAYVGRLGAGRVDAYAAIQSAKDSLNSHTIVADFQASSVTVPQGSTLSFADKSFGNPTSWNWTFEGATPATSSLKNPSNIKYDNPGTFNVSLTVSDGTQTNTETKNYFILVYTLRNGAWLPQTTGFSAQSTGIDYISIVDPNTVWANAYDGSGNGTNIQQFTKTYDGGVHWSPGSYAGAPSNYAVSSITATDIDTAWISMYNKEGGMGKGGIYVTHDGGANWNQQTTASFSSSSSFPNFVYFWDGKHGICQGDPENNYFEIYTTTDGGTTWNRVPSASIPVALSGEYGFTSLYAVYGNTIWFGTNKGRIFKSVDNGLNWTVSSTGLPEITRMGFHDENTGIITYVSYDQTTGAVVDFKMMKTVNGGGKWTPITPSGNYFTSDIAVIKDEPGLLISTGISQDLAQSGSAYSLDDGQSWTQLDDSIQYTTVKFYSRSVGWAGGFNESPTSRGIWKWLKGDVGVHEISDNYQFEIYPNPSSGKIHFRLPKIKAAFDVEIYDLLGRKMKAFTNIDANTHHEYTLNLNGLDKGVYILLLKQNNSLLKAKKLMVQ